MPGVAIDRPIPEETHQPYNRKTLPNKVESNSRGMVWYRSDYELRYLRVAKVCRCKWEKSFRLAAQTNDIATMSIASKELREWCERERALLRIARPAAQTVKSARHADRLDRETTATVVDVQETSQHTQ